MTVGEKVDLHASSRGFAQGLAQFLGQHDVGVVDHKFPLSDFDEGKSGET